MPSKCEDSSVVKVIRRADVFTGPMISSGLYKARLTADIVIE